MNKPILHTVHGPQVTNKSEAGLIMIQQCSEEMVSLVDCDVESANLHRIQFNDEILLVNWFHE